MVNLASTLSLRPFAAYHLKDSREYPCDFENPHHAITEDDLPESGAVRVGRGLPGQVQPQSPGHAQHHRCRSVCRLPVFPPEHHFFQAQLVRTASSSDSAKSTWRIWKWGRVHQPCLNWKQLNWWMDWVSNILSNEKSFVCILPSFLPRKNPISTHSFPVSYLSGYKKTWKWFHFLDEFYRWEGSFCLCTLFFSFQRGMNWKEEKSVLCEEYLPGLFEIERKNYIKTLEEQFMQSGKNTLM